MLDDSSTNDSGDSRRLPLERADLVLDDLATDEECDFELDLIFWEPEDEEEEKPKQ